MADNSRDCPFLVDMATTTHTASLTNGQSPEITLYTNHGCPWAHRAHTTLRALNIPYKEVIIPLDRPRDPWYLEINPRGLVPSIKITTADGKIKDEIITESGIVSTFLAEMFPDSKFWPRSEENPLMRARINFFVDTWFTMVNKLMYPILRAEGEEKEKLGSQLVAAVKKEIEPLLKNAEPFFGGSKHITLAEALTAPFVVRYQAYIDGGLMPSILKELDALPNYSKWSKAVCNEDSVTYIFDGPEMLKLMAARIAKLNAEAKN